MQGLFVTGTDTGIGKTLVSAWLTHHWRAEYWKPVQTGANEDSDSGTVAALAPGARIHPPAYLFKAPLSPHQAAALEAAHIDIERLTTLPASQGPLVVEGAGGIMVPLTPHVLTLDYAARLGLAVLVVARSGLGTVNHTLLSIEALRRRDVPILGVVMNGPLNPANRQDIEKFGQVRVLAEIEPLARVDAAAIAAIAPPAFSCPNPAFSCPNKD